MMPTNDFEVFLTILDYVIQFVSFFVIAYFTIRYIDKKRGVQGRPWPLWFIGLFLLSASIYDLLNFLDYDYYELMFLDLPKWLIVLRYIFSILLRCFIVYVTFGVLYFNERARKFLIALSIFTIVTIYWKHPYSAFEKTAFVVEDAFFGASSELRYPQYPWISMLVYIIADLLIAGLTVYCLSLDNIKALFKNEKQTPTAKKTA